MIATELIFDKDGKTVIGFENLDPKSISMHFDTTLAKFVWIQNGDNPKTRRVLLHDQVLITNK